jgi:hypothetical protein
MNFDEKLKLLNEAIKDCETDPDLLVDREQIHDLAQSISGDPLQAATALLKVLTERDDEKKRGDWARNSLDYCRQERDAATKRAEGLAAELDELRTAWFGIAGGEQSFPSDHGGDCIAQQRIAAWLADGEKARTDLAAAQQAVGLMTTIKPDMVVNVHDPLVMAQQVATEVAKLRAQLAAANAQRDELAKWIATNGRYATDWTCRECNPHSPDIVEGFACTYHTAIAIARAQSGQPTPAERRDDDLSKNKDCASDCDCKR